MFVPQKPFSCKIITAPRATLSPHPPASRAEAQNKAKRLTGQGQAHQRRSKEQMNPRIGAALRTAPRCHEQGFLSARMLPVIE